MTTIPKHGPSGRGELLFLEFLAPFRLVSTETHILLLGWQLRHMQYGPRFKHRSTRPMGAHFPNDLRLGTWRIEYYVQLQGSTSLAI